MTKNEQNRIVAWRLKLLREASVMPRNVAQACRHFGLSRNTFYKWKARHRAHGEAGLLDRSRAPRRSPRATPREVVSKILYLRQRYHFGPGRIRYGLWSMLHEARLDFCMLIGALYLLIEGAGAWSMDARLSRGPVSSSPLKD